MEKKINYLQEKKGLFLRNFQKILSIPTISSEKKYSSAIFQRFKWIIRKLAKLGCKRVNVHNQAIKTNQNSQSLTSQPIIITEKKKKLNFLLFYFTDIMMSNQ